MLGRDTKAFTSAIGLMVMVEMVVVDPLFGHGYGLVGTSAVKTL